ncbi:MAG: ATP-binding cassette domain-containing protein [Actinomycetota bacterium]|nr:ATP-binding cassette domain-containing protein [Actinomycetota bacterium]
MIELDGIGAVTPDGRQLFANLELKLDPRERLGIVGPNGAGKTTLLEIIARRREPAAGTVTWGSTVELGYFSQTGGELDLTVRAREFVAGPHRKPDWTDARLLESFWFDTDAQWAEIGTLSGGERRRLQLLRVLADKPNVLLLDEPTNDLDLETLRALEDFLEDWPGAVVVVSHDRALLERVVADALIVADGRAARWAGGYNAWDEQRKRGGATSTKSASTKPSTKQTAKGVADGPVGTAGRSASTLGHLIRAAEKEMARLEARKTRLEAELVAAGSDHEMLIRVGQELGDAASSLGEVEERWLQLSEEREG